MLAKSSLTPRVAVIIAFLLSAPNASSMVRGVVSSVTPSSLIVQTDTGSVTFRRSFVGWAKAAA